MPISWYGEIMVRNNDGQDVLARYITTDIDMLKIESIGSNTVRSSGKYGINSTFFYLSTLLGIAVQDGAYVENGTKNGSSTNVYSRGTLYRLTNGTVGVKPVKYATDIAPLSDIKWAIGGISLNLDKTYSSETEFNSAINSEVGSVDVASKLTRTAVGIDANNKIYLITFFDPTNENNRLYGVDLFDVHNILKNTFKLTKAVNLDGGGSTAIAKNSSTGIRTVFDVEERAVRVMLTVPGASFYNV